MRKFPSATLYVEIIPTLISGIRDSPEIGIGSISRRGKRTFPHPWLSKSRARSRALGLKSTCTRQRRTSSCAVCISRTCIYRVNDIILFERALSPFGSGDAPDPRGGGGGSSRWKNLARTLSKLFRFFYSPRYNFCNISATTSTKIQEGWKFVSPFSNSTLTRLFRYFLSEFYELLYCNVCNRFRQMRAIRIHGTLLKRRRISNVNGYTVAILYNVCAANPNSVGRS